MKTIIFISFAAFIFAGCVKLPPVPQAEKEVLRKILTPTFVITSIPKEREEDFYRLLEVFARKKTNDETVTMVEFRSEGEAVMQFSWSGGYHGGMAIVKKLSGKWTIVDMLYAV